MKKPNFSSLVRVVKTSVFALGFLLCLQSAASAQETPKPNVQYVGSLDGKPVFKVDLDNESGSVYDLTIKDDQGTILYTQRIREKQFSKKFKFDNANYDNVKLTFVLSNNKETQSQEFKVNTKTRVFNDVVVTTL